MVTEQRQALHAVFAGPHDARRDSITSGGSMRRTITATAVLAGLLLTGGCSSGDDGDGGDPKPSASATQPASPSLSEAEARAACVDAWADALLEDPKLGVDQEPAECAGLPGDDRLDRYMEGLQQRNAINRG